MMVLGRPLLAPPEGFQTADTGRADNGGVRGPGGQDQGIAGLQADRLTGLGQGEGNVAPDHPEHLGPGVVVQGKICTRRAGPGRRPETPALEPPPDLGLGGWRACPVVVVNRTHAVIIRYSARADESGARRHGICGASAEARTGKGGVPVTWRGAVLRALVLVGIALVVVVLAVIATFGYLGAAFFYGALSAAILGAIVLYALVVLLGGWRKPTD